MPHSPIRQRNHSVARMVLLLALPALLLVAAGVPRKLRKAYQALEVYNYFEAKDLFYRSLKKDSAAAAFGLAVIYSRDDNPFYNPDSAYKYAYLAEDHFLQLDSAQRGELSAELPIDSARIAHQRYLVDRIYYRAAQAAAEVSLWNEYLRSHRSHELLSRARSMRDSLAFALAEQDQRAAAYQEFAQQYPDATQHAEAMRRYERLLYQEQTVSKDPGAYQLFIENYPSSPYLSDAHYALYQLFRSKGTPEALLEYARAYPDYPYADEAWRTIYELEIGELSPRAIAAFSLKYPNYPFAEELRRDFDLATTRFYPAASGGRWGFIDEDGRWRIKPQYDWAEPFAEGFAAVGRGGMVGFIDKLGAVAVPFTYTDAYAFREGFAVVEGSKGMGAVDRTGREVITPRYQDLGEYAEGLFYAANDTSYGYLNQSGQVAIPFIYSDASDFRKGRAVVAKQGQSGVISKDGSELSAFDFDWIESFYGEDRPARTRKDQRYGLLDYSGRELTSPRYQRIGDYHEGLALAQGGHYYGFINTRGDTLIDFEYDFSQEALTESYFEGGRARIFFEGRVGVIDTSGKRIYPAIFEDIGAWHPRRMAVKKRGKWGYADADVNLVIPYHYLDAGDFSDGNAIVAKESGYGLIDSSGTVLIPLRYRSVQRLDSLFLLQDSVYHIATAKHHILLTANYSEAVLIDAHVLQFKSDTQGMGYYDYRRHKWLWRENEGLRAP